MGKKKLLKNYRTTNLINTLEQVDYVVLAPGISFIKNKNLIQVGQTIIINVPNDSYFMGDDNFIAITKYNRSHFYAKAVYDLSLEFKN